MSNVRIAVLGGDRREGYIAARLQDKGYDVALYGAPADDGVVVAPTAEAAVAGAQWIVGPSPGLGDGDVVYAPHAETPIVLGSDLLERSDVKAGGIVLGRATPTLKAATDALGVTVYEMKDDRQLAAANARSVAEAIVARLVGKTVRILPEHRILVVGYGATGSALTAALVGLSCQEVSVAARRPESLSAIEARGANPVRHDDRIAAMAAADIVVNTVPSVDAVPPEAYPGLRGTLVVDIASPPGGLDHEGAAAAGVDVTWARGLAGGRAPHSAGDSQLDFILRSIAARGEAVAPVAAGTGT